MANCTCLTGRHKGQGKRREREWKREGRRGDKREWEEGRGSRRKGQEDSKHCLLKNRMPISEKERILLQPSIQTGTQRKQLKPSQSHNAPKLVT